MSEAEQEDNYRVKWQHTSDGETDGTPERQNSCSDSDASITNPSDDDMYLSSPEYRLSQILQEWMPNYVVTPIEPQTSSKKEPLYSAKLGVEPRIKRVQSCESIVTQLSLLSCSTYGKRTRCDDKKRRKRKEKSDRSVTGNSSGSKWIELANRRQGVFDKMFQQHNAHATGVATGLEGGQRNLAFEMMDEDEKKLLFRCGLESGLKMAKGLKKSDSTTNIIKNLQNDIRRYSQVDIGPQKSKLSNIMELHKQATRQKMATRSLSNSKHSLNSLNKPPLVPVPFVRMATVDKPTMRTVTPPFKEKVSMWQVDDRVPDGNNPRSMSAAVQKRITSTTIALERASRVDQKRPNTTAGCRGVFSRKDSKNIKISPELSNVIQQDIKKRIGNPRYHELRERDIHAWERDQQLNRSYRNLKVFNWLHSLKEEQFDLDVDDGNLEYLSTSTTPCQQNFAHVEAVDEQKPQIVTSVS